MTNMPRDQSEVIQIIQWCRDHLRPRLPPDALSETLSDAMNGEEGLASESLVDNLYEHNAVPPQGLIDRITTVGHAMGMEGRLWRVLQLLTEGGPSSA